MEFSLPEDNDIEVEGINAESSEDALNKEEEEEEEEDKEEYLPTDSGEEISHNIFCVRTGHPIMCKPQWPADGSLGGQGDQVLASVLLVCLSFSCPE